MLVSGQMADLAEACDVAHVARVSSRIPCGVSLPRTNSTARCSSTPPSMHAQDCSVQEHTVLFFKCQVKPKPAKLCPGGWGVTIRTTTVRKRPRLGSKDATLLAFSDHPGPPQSPHLSAETYGYYLKPFNKLQAACYSRGHNV